MDGKAVNSSKVEKSDLIKVMKNTVIMVKKYHRLDNRSKAMEYLTPANDIQ
jgi:hypothetical protein